MEKKVFRAFSLTFSNFWRKQNLFKESETNNSFMEIFHFLETRKLRLLIKKISGAASFFYNLQARQFASYKVRCINRIIQLSDESFAGFGVIPHTSSQRNQKHLKLRYQGE